MGLLSQPKNRLSIDKIQSRELRCTQKKPCRGFSNVVNYCFKILHVVYLYSISFSSSLIYFKCYLLKINANDIIIVKKKTIFSSSHKTIQFKIYMIRSFFLECTKYKNICAKMAHKFFSSLLDSKLRHTVKAIRTKSFHKICICSTLAINHV